MLVAGKAVCHAVALDEGCKARAVRLAVFNVLDLRLVGDQRGGNVGIVDRAADRRVRDLVADAAAGLEAVGKAAAPQVRLVEVNAAAVLHDVAADGGDVSDLRGRRQRRRLRDGRVAAVQKLALGKLGERHRCADDELAVLFLQDVQLRNFLQKDEVLVAAHLVFQQRHDVRAAADVGRVLGGDDVV